MPQSLYDDGQDNKEYHQPFKVHTYNFDTTSQNNSLYDSQGNIKYITRMDTDGKTRYSYKDKNGAEHSFYSYEEPTTRINKKQRIIVFVTLIILSIVGAIALIVNYVPIKLSRSACRATGGGVVDLAGMMTSEEKSYIETAFTSFYEATGVQPYIFTVKISEVPSEYVSDSGYSGYYHNNVYYSMSDKQVESYSQYLYDYNFDDQGHWLIVIIDNKQAGWGNNRDYSIGHIVGNKASKIVNKSVWDKFYSEAFLGGRSGWWTSIEYSASDIASATYIAKNQVSDNRHSYIVYILVSWVVVFLVLVYLSIKSIHHADDVNGYLDFVKSGSTMSSSIKDVNKKKDMTFKEIKEAYLKEQEERDKKRVSYSQDDRIAYAGNNKSRKTVDVTAANEGTDFIQQEESSRIMVCPYCGKSYDITEASCPYCAGDNPAV